MPEVLVFVLSVGRSSDLLAVRNRVLGSHGYIVVSADDDKQALDLFRGSDFDVVLLCHSIPHRERDELIRMMKASRRLTPIVTIEGRDFAEPHLSADRSVLGLDGPEALFSVIESVLSHRPRAAGTSGN